MMSWLAAMAVAADTVSVRPLCGLRWNLYSLWLACGSRCAKARQKVLFGAWW